jgi:hypothetical protein
MELRDGLKALELVREIVGEISDEAVDKLHKIVTLGRADRHHVIKYFVVASRMKLVA